MLSKGRKVPVSNKKAPTQGLPSFSRRLYDKTLSNIMTIMTGAVIASVKHPNLLNHHMYNKADHKWLKHGPSNKPIKNFHIEVDRAVMKTDLHNFFRPEQLKSRKAQRVVTRAGTPGPRCAWPGPS